MAGKVGQTEALIQALARGLSHAAAAKLAGVSVRTVQRRLTDPDFCVRVREARGRMFDRSAGHLASNATAAAKALADLLKDASPSIRLSAARAILDAARAMRDVLDTDVRLDAIEEFQDEQKRQKRQRAIVP